MPVNDEWWLSSWSWWPWPLQYYRMGIIGGAAWRKRWPEVRRMCLVAKQRGLI